MGVKQKLLSTENRIQWPFPHSFAMKKCHLSLNKRPVQEDTANLLAAAIVDTSWKPFFSLFLLGSLEQLPLAFITL